MTENSGVYTALKSAVKVDTRVSIFYLRSALVADLSSPAWLACEQANREPVHRLQPGCPLLGDAALVYPGDD